jgi:PAS domain S-box-containing protein
MSLLFDTERVHRWAKRLQRIRRRPLVVWCIVLGGVVLASLVRWAIRGNVLDRIPFTTYYPAIVVATLLGGFWLGTLASILSATLAWWVFMPPVFGFTLDAAQATSLLAFILVCLLLVGTVTALNSAIDLLLVELDHRQETQLALRQLASVIETSDDAIITKDLNGIITNWNRGAERVFGYAPDEVIGKPIRILIPSDRDDEEPSILERLRKGQRIEHYETVRRRKDGDLIDISLSVSPLANAAGTIVGASKIARDITERKRAEMRQQMLVKEMSHRVKNAFTIVNGIVGLSAKYAKPEALVGDIQARLSALARAHDLTRPGLLSTQPTTGPASFRGLVGAIFAPYLDANTEPDRLNIVGPDMEIQEQSVTGMALMLYELATNALKWGSLSLPTGRVQIELSVTDRKFDLKWEELGGPKLSGSPKHEGFGTNLVRRIVSDQFGGEVSCDWKPEGLIVRLRASSDRVLDAGASPCGATYRAK